MVSEGLGETSALGECVSEGVGGSGVGVGVAECVVVSVALGVADATKELVSDGISTLEVECRSVAVSVKV